VAHPDSDDLPVPADLVLARYAQLGAQSAWISRSFFHGGLTPDKFAGALSALHARLAWWFAQSPAQWDVAAEKLRSAVHRLSASRRIAS
jgi:hypothetical protein